MQLDVVEILLLGALLERVRGLTVGEVGVVRVPETRVLVEGDLAVEGDHLAGRVLDQRVDLDQRRVLLGEHGPELLQDRDDLVAHVRGEACGVADLRCLRGVDPDERVDGDLGQRLRSLDRELLDLHPALDRRHRQVGAVGAVQQERDVVLGLDVAGRRDQDAMDRVALDVHAEDVAGAGERLVRPGGQLDAAGLAPAAGLDLGLDDDGTAETGSDRARLVGGGGHAAGKGRDPVLAEEVLGLVLEQVHRHSCLRCGRPALGGEACSAQRRPGWGLINGRVRCRVPTPRCGPSSYPA